MTPRIDIYDHSNGQAPPAYAVSPTIGALGSEYLFVGMGCGMIGVYSLATGQQGLWVTVREGEGVMRLFVGTYQEPISHLDCALYRVCYMLRCASPFVWRTVARLSLI